MWEIWDEIDDDWQRPRVLRGVSEMAPERTHFHLQVLVLLANHMQENHRT